MDFEKVKERKHEVISCHHTAPSPEQSDGLPNNKLDNYLCTPKWLIRPIATLAHNELLWKWSTNFRCFNHVYYCTYFGQTITSWEESWEREREKREGRDISWRVWHERESPGLYLDDRRIVSAGTLSLSFTLIISPTVTCGKQTGYLCTNKMLRGQRQIKSIKLHYPTPIVAKTILCRNFDNTLLMFNV